MSRDERSWTSHCRLSNSPLIVHPRTSLAEEKSRTLAAAALGAAMMELNRVLA
ncbi:MAG: hypothetical protein H0X71_09065 [Rubrobacter sp.]|nr:hypothetical protein [Rubrobacter sp.]